MRTLEFILPKGNKRIEGVLKIISFLLFSAFLILFFFRPIELDDVWWHLAAGKFIEEHLAVPLTDPFPFSDKKIAFGDNS